MYNELPRQDPDFGCWGDAVKEQMLSMEFTTSELHPPSYWNETRWITAAVHVDELLCIGLVEACMWWYGTLGEKYASRNTCWRPAAIQM